MQTHFNKKSRRRKAMFPGIFHKNYLCQVPDIFTITLLMYLCESSKIPTEIRSVGIIYANLASTWTYLASTCVCVFPYFGVFTIHFHWHRSNIQFFTLSFGTRSIFVVFYFEQIVPINRIVCISMCFSVPS